MKLQEVERLLAITRSGPEIARAVRETVQAACPAAERPTMPTSDRLRLRPRHTKQTTWTLILSKAGVKIGFSGGRPRCRIRTICSKATARCTAMS